MKRWHTDKVAPALHFMKRPSLAVASGILPDVEGARLAARISLHGSERVEIVGRGSAGRDAAALRQA
jgi:hypothetical protein